MDDLQKSIEKIITKLFDIKESVSITVAPANTGADYASNTAMQLARLVHKSPMVIAEMIKSEFIKDNNTYVLEIAAPGFLNFTLDDTKMISEARNLAEQWSEKIKNHTYKNKTVVAEFSDPNPFKVLHVGHLYTSIVGDSISKLLEFAEAKVIRANFGGDVGMHVAKTLYSLLRNPEIKLENLKIEDIAKCYVAGTQAYDEDEAAKTEITKLNKEIYQINAQDLHDSKLAEYYWRGRELSYQYFDQFYAKIGIKFDRYYPESSVVDRGLHEVKAHTGTTYEESDGAVVYKGEKVGLHTRVFINREGVPTYETKDVGLIFTKWDDWKFDESIVITGNEQSDYMKVVLASVSEYSPQLVDRTTHLTHGLVKLPGNVKMSSRKGNFLKAIDVLRMVEDQLRENLRNNQKSAEQIDQRLVLAAIKYAFLKYKLGGDIIFDPKESVSMVGNSGIYLLYSAVRAHKILQKKGIQAKQRVSEDLAKEQKSEKTLSKKLVQYLDVLSEAITLKAPYKICNYLYELAQEFSRFYEQVQVAGNVREAELMQLVQAYYNILEHGLGLLGIEIPEVM